MLNKSKELIAILLCAPIFGIGIDLYTPSLPYISTYFSSTAAATQMTISSFILGGFIGMLIFGTLADTFGRRKIILISLLTYALFNVLTIFSTDMMMVIFFRFIVGICAGSAFVMNRAQTTDLFIGSELKKVIAAITIAWGLGPILAPFIGGFLQHYIGWQACFIFLALYALIVFFAMYMFVLETHRERHPFKLSKVINNYKIILLSPVFSSAILQMGIIYGMLIYFGIVGSFYVQQLLHYSAITYGNLSLLIGFAFFLGSILCKILTFHKDDKILSIGYRLLLICNISLFIISFFIQYSLLILVINIFISCLCAGLLYPIYLSHCLKSFPMMAGTASAISGSVVMLIIFIISVIVSFFDIHSLSEFILLYLFTSLVSLGIRLISIKLIACTK